MTGPSHPSSSLLVRESHQSSALRQLSWASTPLSHGGQLTQQHDGWPLHRQGSMVHAKSLSCATLSPCSVDGATATAPTAREKIVAKIAMKRMLGEDKHLRDDPSSTGEFQIVHNATFMAVSARKASLRHCSCSPHAATWCRLQFKEAIPSPQKRSDTMCM
jgi:hypothetical protein